MCRHLADYLAVIDLTGDFSSLDEEDDDDNAKPGNGGGRDTAHNNERKQIAGQKEVSQDKNQSILEPTPVPATPDTSEEPPAKRVRLGEPSRRHETLFILQICKILTRQYVTTINLLRIHNPQREPPLYNHRHPTSNPQSQIPKLILTIHPSPQATCACSPK